MVKALGTRMIAIGIGSLCGALGRRSMVVWGIADKSPFCRSCLRKKDKKKGDIKNLIEMKDPQLNQRW